MDIRHFDTPEAATTAVAQIIIEQLKQKPDSVLVLPTGGSPLKVYAQLRRAFDQGQISFRDARIFNLDEYVGVGADHPSSYAHYMRDALFDHVDCPPAQTHIPDGAAVDPDAEAAAYDEKIAAAGGADLLFLGIGRNGHIAFNEPGSSHSSRTRVVTLADDTVTANARFFDSKDDVPTKAITMGIGTILEAKRIVLLAIGDDKAEAVARSFQDEESDDFPASALNSHPHCKVIVDFGAGRLLGMKADPAEDQSVHRSVGS